MGRAQRPLDAVVGIHMVTEVLSALPKQANENIVVFQMAIFAVCAVALLTAKYEINNNIKKEAM